MNRRDLFWASVTLAISPSLRATQAAIEGRPVVMTVLGPIDPTEMGTTLPHEHVLVDFGGAEVASPDRYEADEVIAAARPQLCRAPELGCRTLCECTPAYLARDPGLLAKLSEAIGVHLLTNTGYDNANRGKHLPEHARQQSSDRLADCWTEEWERGIGDSGIRPGFIKLGVDRGPLSETSRTLLRAAAITHRRTGLTIAAHSGDGIAAREELDVIEAEGVDPLAFIWVHAQNERDTNVHAALAARGAWVEFDGIEPDSIGRHIELVQTLKEAGHLDRALISHDAGWYHVGEPGGGRFRPFDTLFERFLPLLEEAGFPGEERRRLTPENPAEAFAVWVRLAKG